MHRKEPIQDRAKFTSDSILEAAEIIILTEGYGKATTNYIAEKAGVSIGSLYQYFPNKHEIISSLIERAVSTVAIGLRNVLRESMEMPLLEASRKCYSYLLNSFRDRKELFYILPKQSFELAELTKNLSVERFTHQTSLTLIEQHRDEIVVDDLEVALVTLEIATLSNLRRYIIGDHCCTNDEQFLDSMVRLSTAYLTAKLD